MSERYSRLFALPQNLYIEASPVIVRAGALLKDNTTNRLIAQLKFSNIQNKNIKLVKVEIECLDGLGRSLEDVVTYEYLDLNVARSGEFGAKTPIAIKNVATRAFSVRVTEVGFADNTVWTNTDGVWESFGEQPPISSIISDGITLMGYRMAFGEEATHHLLESGTLWFCTCGSINHSGEAKCCHCGVLLVDLKTADYSELRKKQLYTNAMDLYTKNDPTSLKKAQSIFEELGDYLDCATLAEESKAKLLQATGKKRKILKWTGISLAGVVVLALLSIFVIYPFSARAVGNYTPYINTYKIKEFKIPDGTKEIKNREFQSCESLTSVTIPDSVTSIGDWAFEDCTSLTSVTIPDGVTSIGSHAFQYCESLTSVTIPDSVTSIGSNAFYYCTSLTSIHIPSSVQQVDDYAFYSCSQLQTVTFGENSQLLSIGSNAFRGCTSLTSVTIPDGVTSIGDYAFQYCESLTSVTIPDSVTSIGDSAFYSCDNLTSVTIGNSVTSIGDDAFMFCNSLTSVTIPDSVTSIGDSAFYSCDNLTSVTIPDSVTSIGEMTFYFCDSLMSVTIPDSVTTIGDYAFKYCESLTSINYRGTKAQWYAISKGYNWQYGTGNYTITYNYTGE